jgi:lysophospholipase L1-like esterase
MADPDNEGFPGLRIEEVLTHAQADVPNYLPNLYTINLGTNDASQDFDLPNAGGRMGSLLDFLWSATPDATVILSTLIINLDANVDSRAQAINAQYTDLANRLSGDGRRIVLADMHGADGPQTGDMSDATHPNDNGFRLMSNIWARAIQQAADSGFLQPPV